MEQENRHAHSPKELQRTLYDIEEELKKPVDEKALTRLFQQLEIAQEDCSFMKTKYSLFAEQLISESEEKIRSLFGKVVNSHVDTEVDQLVEMSKKLSKEDLAGLALFKKKVDALKKKYRLSKENLLKISGCNSLPIQEEVNPEEAENLLRLASLVYHKNKHERNKIYCCLSNSAKDRFHKHLICLKTKAFEKEESTIQALFASALEISGAPAEYPTPHEIEDFFSEEPKDI